MGARKYACGEGRPRNNPPSEEEMELQRQRRNLTRRVNRAAAQGNDPSPIDQERSRAFDVVVAATSNARVQQREISSREANESERNLQRFGLDYMNHLNESSGPRHGQRFVSAGSQSNGRPAMSRPALLDQSFNESSGPPLDATGAGARFAGSPPGLAASRAPLPAFDNQGSFTAGAAPFAGAEPSFAAGAGPTRTGARLPAIEHRPTAQQNQEEPSLLEEDLSLTLIHSNPHLLQHHLLTSEMRTLRTENQQSAEAMRALRADNDGLARQHLEDLARIRALEVALQADNDGLARQHLEDLARIRALELELESLRSQHREATGRIHALQTASTSAIRSLEPVQTMVRDHVTCTLCSKEMDELLLCESCGFTHHCTNCENLWGPKRCLKCRSPGETGFWGPVSLAQASQIARAVEQSVEELGGAATTSVSPEIITLLDTDDEEDDVASGGDKESPSPVASGVASGGDKEIPKAGPVASGSEEPLSEEEARLLEEAKQASLAEYLRVFDDTSSDEEDVEKTSSDEEDRKPAAKPSVKTEDNYDSDSEFSFGF